MRQSLTENFTTFLLLFLASFLFIFLDNLGVFRPAKSILQVVTIPIQHSFYASGQRVKKEAGLLWQMRGLYQENLALKSQNDFLRAEVSQMAQLKVQNQVLMAQLSQPSQASFKLLAANTLGLGRYLEIDKGEEMGVRRGMVIIIGDNFVGEVAAVTPRIAQIKTTFDPDLKVAVNIQMKEGGYARGMVSGSFGAGMKLEQVLQEEKIGVDDLVVTSGGQGMYPKGLIIGKITKIEKKETDIFQAADVVPLFDLDKLQTVFVILER